MNMVLGALGVYIAHALCMLVDEFYFHYRRGLPRWERVGHPLDTLTVLMCFSLALWAPVTQAQAQVYACVSVFSSFFVTKDEFVHAQKCSGGEHWLHSLLFILHPMVLLMTGFLWWTEQGLWLVRVQWGLMVVFLFYQILFWNFFYARRHQ